jgi:hypothetical protein
MSFSVGDNDATNDYFVFGNTSSGFVERFKITATGVVTIGTWNGSAIADAYISSAATWNGKVSSVSATSPVLSSGGTTPTISIPAATTSVSGYLTSTDWNTFNNKQSTITNPVTGTGNTSYVPKFSSSSAITDSSIYNGASGFVSIGNTNTSSYNLDVTGSGRVTTTLNVGTTAYVNTDLYVGDTTSGGGRFFVTDAANQGIVIRRLGSADRFKMFVGNGTTYTQDNCIILGTNTDIDFYTGSSPIKRLTIQNGGGLMVPSDVSGTSGYKINYTSADAGSRSWKIANDSAAYGDFVIAQSTTQSGSTYATKFIINPSGNVGIGGETNPSYPLQFGSNFTNAGTISSGGNLNAAAYFGSGGLTLGTQSTTGHTALFTNSSARDIIFGGWNGSTNAERMRITSGGNVGIGRTSAFNPNNYDSNRRFLSIQATTGGVDRGAYLELIGTAGGSPDYWLGRIAFASTTTTSNNHAEINCLTDSGGSYSGSLIFSTTANASTTGVQERMRITSGGLVGIQTTTPVGKLAVLTNGTWFTPTNTGAIGGASSQRVNLVGSEPGIMLSSDNSTGTQTSQIGLQIGNYGGGDIRSQLYWGGNPLVFMYSGDNGSSATNRFSISTAGNVGLTRSATTNTLEVNGDASKSTAGSWLANSDINIKTNINTIEGALDRINKVRLVSFKYKDAYKEANNGIKDKYYHNVIAQEFQEIYPDYVYDSGDLFEEHKVLQVDTNPMYVDSVSAIQELSKMVIELQERIKQLENK